MPAVKKNKYAEKWTKKEVLELMDKAAGFINEECYFLSEVCLSCGVYPEWISRMLKKFQGDEQVCQAIKKVQLKCESIITRKTGKGEIVPSLGIFILKSYHNLVEPNKVEQDVRVSGALLAPIQIISDAEGKKLLDQIMKEP